MIGIKEFATLEKLSLTEAEADYIQARAKELESSFEAMSAVNTDGVEPLVTVLNLNNVLREDVAVKMLTRDELLENAPEQYDGYFQVPKTLD